MFVISLRNTHPVWARAARSQMGCVATIYGRLAHKSFRQRPVRLLIKSFRQRARSVPQRVIHRCIGVLRILAERTRGIYMCSARFVSKAKRLEHHRELHWAMRSNLSYISASFTPKLNVELKGNEIRFWKLKTRHRKLKDRFLLRI